MNKWPKTIAGVLAIVLFIQAPLAVAASDISQAQEEKNSLEAQLAEAQKLIDGLQGSKDSIEDKVEQLDKQLTDITAQINALESDLDNKSVEIEDTKTALAQAQEQESTQYEQMKKRIQYMYENNTQMSYIEAFITSGSLGDFINRVEYIKQITEYDRDMLAKYQDTQVTIANSKATLEQDYSELEELKAQVEQEKQAVASLMAAKESELSTVDGQLSEAEKSAEECEAEIQAQNDIIAQIQAAEAAKQAAKAAAEAEAAKRAEEQAAAQQEAGDTEQPAEAPQPEEPVPEIPDDTYNGGVFTWPCPSSNRVTSDYGNRLSPTAGASSNHKGIDIGAEYGSAIVAAADGTVTFAGYSSSSGNYIMLSHGSGLYTIYCHASALLVSTGETVTTGQTIAQVGSTGISTGNHLHFGVTLNGSYVSPWNYLSR